MRQLIPVFLRISVCAAVAAVLLSGSNATADDARTGRLEALCRVWAAAKYSHPAMLTRDVDWDGALVRAVPRVRDASTDADLAAAIGGMLNELGDPATHVDAPTQKKSATAAVSLLRHDGDVLIVSAAPAVDWSGFDALWSHSAEVTAAVSKAGKVVVDISTGDPDTAEAVSEFLSGTTLWTGSGVDGVPSWTTFYSGYAPQRGFTSGGYYSALMLRAGAPIRAAKSAPGRLAFVTDGKMPLPPAVVALWRAGKAAIVSSSPVTDASDLRQVAIAGGYAAQIRGGEYAIGSIAADVVAPDALEAAVKFVHGSSPLQPRDAPLRMVPAAHQIDEAPYLEMKAPDLPHRLLAAFRIWSTIHYFYPYKPLIGDWDAVLREFIPRFEEAEGEEAYAEAVLEMTAHIEDGHTGAYGHPAIAKILPYAFVPFVLDRVDGEPVVVEKIDPMAPLSLGDVIVSVDGEPMDARIQRLWKYIPGATEPARMARVMNMAMHGAPGSVAHLQVRGADGVVHAVDVPRLTSLPKTTSGETPWRVLAGNIGYADLRQLTVAQVDPMFDALSKTKAIIFDMRGYPKGTAWPIASRINTRHATTGALFRRPQFSGADSADEGAAGYFFEQLLPKSDKPLYAGKVVVLIDDRAISQSEHSCLFFEQAAGATFVGTTTAGSNGDVTNFVLPGGFLVYFTGHDVRHADGRQLQRVGIRPDVLVSPTIAGLRAGKDEVLERAVAYIESGSGVGPPGIAEFNAALDSATRRMDNAAVMALWADDGVSLLPSHAPIEGKKAIAAFLDSVTSSNPGARMESFHMTCRDIRVSGDLATEWCSEHQVVRFSDGRPPFDGHGKMLLVLQKDGTGAWKLKAEMWNQGTPADE